MISRFRPWAHREQRKLLLSLFTNFMTRIPGTIGLLWFLPLLHSDLGTERFASLLSAMALGNAAGFLASGTNLMGRRLVGQSYSHTDQAGEANGAASVVLANGLAVSITVATVALYCWLRGVGFAYMTVAAIVPVTLFLAMLDEMRVAYNEHYITALVFIALQSISYAIGFLVPEARQSIVAGALVLQSPYMLASLITGAVLLYQRPYLLKGWPVAIKSVLRQGSQLAVADGFMLATLSLSVVWLQSSVSTPTAAWFATVVRLFQTFLIPVVLLLIPLSSYIRIVWNNKSPVQRRTFTKATLVLGFAYGATVAVALYVASQFYVGQLLHLPVPNGGQWIFLLFGVIVAYKCYSCIAYVVQDNPVHLSAWTTAVVGAAVVVGAVASFAVDPLSAVNVFALVAGVAMTAVLIWNTAHSVISLPVTSR
jgi:hypothetical protein